MANIVLISCVSSKRPCRTKARDLYISPLFVLNMRYAKKWDPEIVFILSAEYGLLHLDDVIEPYDTTLNRMPVRERKKWASKVISQLRCQCDLEKDHIIILAGHKYREHLIPYLRSHEIPMDGLTIGKQLQFLKKATTYE